jgi:hypothetical protein
MTGRRGQGRISRAEAECSNTFPSSGEAANSSPGGPQKSSRAEDDESMSERFLEPRARGGIFGAQDGHVSMNFRVLYQPIKA